MRVACSLNTVTSHQPLIKNRTFSNKGRGVYLFLHFFMLHFCYQDYRYQIILIIGHLLHVLGFSLRSF